MNRALRALIALLCLAGCSPTAGAGDSSAADPRYGPTCRAADLVVKDGYRLVPSLDAHAKTALDAIGKGPLLTVAHGTKVYAYRSRDWLKRVEVDIRTVAVRDHAIAASSQLASANPSSIDLARFQPALLTFVSAQDTAANAYAALSQRLAGRSVTNADYATAATIDRALQDRFQAFMTPELAVCGVNSGTQTMTPERTSMRAGAPAMIADRSPY